ncbi:histone-lysine N-methyltransferase SETMAR [Elysia marginata]|uniref:Histone-lysine N-methyltransferase SETMAR n=1 Tax=Elysia marginata TaxID=1093978 RepID=A0AAV4EGC8_9GAST|nr:histone-lysine N-methyltransferase SETMAR [Elysia marginata]
MKHEYVNEFIRDISKINVKSDDVHSLKRIFIGDAAQRIVSSMSEENAVSFRKTVLLAYGETADYLKMKLPLRNKNLALLSTLDPNLCGHSKAFSGLQDLFDLLPTVVQGKEKDAFSRVASLLQSDTNVVSAITERKLDKWWAVVMSYPQYAVLSPVLKACLSIFTGPRVESSFSVMNTIITGVSNRLDVATYQAIHKLKYKFLNSGKSCINFFHREDPVNSPVDPSLGYCMQTAGKRMKSHSEKNRKGMRIKFKKKSIHQQAKDIRSTVEKRTDSTIATGVTTIENEPLVSSVKSNVSEGLPSTRTIVQYKASSRKRKNPSAETDHMYSKKTSMDEHREGQPPSVVTEKNVSTVEKLTMQDREITVKQLAFETKISIGSVETILHDHLNLNKVSA